MKKLNRNDLCSCGSGKKFKKCHLGREHELEFNEFDQMTMEEMGKLITSLPMVSYGRSGAMVKEIDIKGLTGSSMGIKFVDLNAYLGLNLYGSPGSKAQGGGGGLFINIYKTIKTDPDHIYLAISTDIDDACLAHELAHVLDYLGGSKLIPGMLEPLALELDMPLEHLEHPEEFGYFLDYLVNKFDICLDADDTIITYLYKNSRLIKGGEIQEKNRLILKSKSDGILRFLSEQSEELNAQICSLPGYIGPRKAVDPD